jgi:hypothetical protein
LTIKSTSHTTLRRRYILSRLLVLGKSVHPIRKRPGPAYTACRCICPSIFNCQRSVSGRIRKAQLDWNRITASGFF